ncbi:MAG: hypothetical protein U0791_09400 [Gemmataceae bacterium]
MVSLSFDDTTTQRLFGHEAAEDEDPKRLREYYFRSGVFDRATANMPLRILVGHKGLGKSALFQVAMQQDTSESAVSILLRPDDVHEVATNADILAAIRSWKEGLLRIIHNRCLDAIGATSTGSPSVLSRGWKLLDSLASIAKPYLSKAVDVEVAKRKLAESLITKKVVRVYIDDLDRGWTATPTSISRLSALLNAARDLVKDHEGLQFRIALRSDVYYLVRTSDESTDKIEGSVVWYSWTNHEILSMLVKRIQSYIGNEFSEDQLVNMEQYRLSSLLDSVMEPRFTGHGKWQNIPTYRMLMSLIRRRPRDLVKLCTLAAHSAFKRKGKCITSVDFASIFDEYSQGRLQDTVNEYRSELPEIETLMLSMKPSRQKRQTGKSLFVYTTADLLKKIRDIQSSQAVFRFYGGRAASEKDLAAFLYKINFLTGRRTDGNKIVRQYFEDNRYLSSSFVDFGFDWEIHPAYRWALQPGETKT